MANAPKYKRCDACGRNEHKVAIKFPDGTVTGECPSCYSPTLNQAADKGGQHAVERAAARRQGLADIGAKLAYDRRGRKPEWTPEMHAELAMLEEMIANFPYASPWADQKLLLSYKQQMNRLLFTPRA